MTAQISDKVAYRNQNYSIAGVNGSGLFDPVEHGLNPCGHTTACWQGYHCTYAVDDNALYLTKLNIEFNNDDEASIAQGIGPKVFGKLPQRYFREWYRKRIWPLKPVLVKQESWDFVISDLKELVPFTGGLLLGRDFIHELYVHMGFHPAYKFRNVYELIFDAGHIVKTYDRSVDMEMFRAKLALSEPEEITTDEWVERCFSLEYKISS